MDIHAPFLDDGDTDCLVSEMWDKIPNNEMRHLVLRLYSELSHYRGLSRGLDRGTQWLKDRLAALEPKP